MSYTVFALKWRPNNFEGIVGQAHIVSTLKNALEKNRLAHAYLFAGPRGVGKTSTARILAKALNCKDGPTTNPCGVCSFCQQITGGRSLDVIEIDGASNRGIDEIRVLRENVKFPPTNGKFKIYIIDEVHMLTPEAFNALLKTLEEPPDFVKFIFATTQANKVLPTIISRCQRFDFRRIPVIEIIAQLQRIVAAEKIDVEKEVLFAIAASSDGALRDAESLLDQLASFSKARISLKDVVSLLGIVEQDALFEITDKFIHKDARGALELLNNIIEDGKDTALFLSNLIGHFRNLMIAKVTKADSKLIDLPQEICDRLLKQSQSFTLEEVFFAFNILVNTQEMCRRLESVRIPLEISLVKLAHDKKAATANHMISAVPLSVAPVVKETKNPDSPVAQHSVLKEETHSLVSLDAIKEAWQSAIDNLSKVKISASTYLNEGSPIELKNNILTVSFPKNCSLHKESLERKENKSIIEKTLSELLRVNIGINFVLSKEEAARRGDDDSQHFIKSAVAAFRARVIKEE